MERSELCVEEWIISFLLTVYYGQGIGHFPHDL